MQRVPNPARLLGSAALLCVLVLAGVARGADAPSPKPQFQLAGISSYLLASGAEVILYPDQTATRTTVSVTYRVGSADDPEDALGLAHLLEHMMFKGTAKTPQVWRELATRGIQFNAATWFERTSYFSVFPNSTETLAWVLGMEADRMTGLLFDASELAREKLVIMNEFDTTEHDRVVTTLQRARATLYKGHAYARPVLGRREHVRDASADTLAGFYRRHYRPANLTLVVAGAIDPAVTLAQLAALFGAKHNDQEQTSSDRAGGMPAGPASIRVVSRGATPAVGLLVSVGAGNEGDYVLANMLGSMLAQGESSPLQRRLVNLGIASRVAYFSDGFRDAGDVFIFVEGVAGGSAEALSHAVDEAIAASLREVLLPDALRAEKERRRQSLAEALQNAPGIDVALLDGIVLGDWRLVFGYYGLTQSATVDQLTSLARRTFGADAQNHLRTARAKGTDVAAVTHRFVEAHAAQVSLGGAGATNNLPTVDYRGIDAATRVRGDGSAAPKLAVYRRDDGRGAVSVALRAYCRGAPLATRSRAAAVLPDLLAARIALPLGGSLQESVTAAGGRIRTAADDQGMMIVLEVPLDKVPAVITQFTTTLTFVDDLDAVARRVVQREVSRMQADRLDPRAVAIAALRTVRRGIAWPQDAPDAAIADLHKIDSALLRSVWTTCLAPRNVGIAVIGPVDEERAPAQLEAILSQWPFGNAESPASAGVDEGWPAIESIAAVPTAKYGFLLTRKRLAVDAASLEFPALVIANFLLGGSTSAALFSRLRYSEGLSYSVGSFLTPQVCDRSTVFGIYASFTPQDFTRFQTAVRGLITTPPLDAVGEAEIHQAVDSIRKDRRASIANDLVLAATLASNLVTGQTMQDAERTDKRLATLSTQDVKAALAKLLAPEGTSLVFAGDLAHN